MTLSVARSECVAISACRLCRSSLLQSVLRLAPTPPANGLSDTPGDRPRKFPLELYRCESCGHIQLGHQVSPQALFSEYYYVSGTSPVMRAHLEAECRAILEFAAHRSAGFVLEIGSNDGTLLQAFQERGWKVLGVDPARNVAQEANKRSIPTICAFFDPTVASQIRARHGKANIVCANHVFAHVENLHVVVDAVKAVIASDGLFVFEVGYLLDVLGGNLFDTIYHEHVDYHHLTPLVSFFAQHGMTVVHADRSDIQGGALRGYVKPGKHPIGTSVTQLIEAEREAGLDTREPISVFGQRLKSVATSIVGCLRALGREGHRIGAYGAPAKATTLLYELGLSRAEIEFVVDDNPLKQGKYLPGLEIPIRPSADLYHERASVIVILAWNFAESIMTRHRKFVEDGGSFVVPLPKMSIVSNDPKVIELSARFLD